MDVLEPIEGDLECLLNALSLDGCDTAKTLCGFGLGLELVLFALEDVDGDEVLVVELDELSCLASMSLRVRS